jgi:hypothetical protein
MQHKFINIKIEQSQSHFHVSFNASSSKDKKQLFPACVMILAFSSRITGQIVHCVHTCRLNLNMHSKRGCLMGLKRMAQKAAGQALKYKVIVILVHII